MQPQTPSIENANPQATTQDSSEAHHQPSARIPTQASLPAIPPPAPTFHSLLSITPIADSIARAIGENRSILVLHSGRRDHFSHPPTQPTLYTRIHALTSPLRYNLISFDVSNPSITNPITMTLEYPARVRQRRRLSMLIDVQNRFRGPLNFLRSPLDARNRNNLRGLDRATRNFTQHNPQSRLQFGMITAFSPSGQSRYEAELFNDLLPEIQSGIMHITPTWHPARLSQTQSFLERLSPLKYVVIGSIWFLYDMNVPSFDLQALYHGIRCHQDEALQQLYACATQSQVLPAWQAPFRNINSWTVRQVSLRNLSDQRFILHLLVGSRNDGRNETRILAVIPQTNARPYRVGGNVMGPRHMAQTTNRFVSSHGALDTPGSQPWPLVEKVERMDYTLEQSAAHWAHYHNHRDPNAPYNPVDNLWYIQYIHLAAGRSLHYNS